MTVLTQLKRILKTTKRTNKKRRTITIPINKNKKHQPHENTNNIQE